MLSVFLISDTSKFSRYDDATDSEDDDDVVGRRRHESASGQVDMSFEDVSSDTEIEVHTNCDNDTEVIEHFNEVEVHNSEQDLNESGKVNEKDLGLTDTESAIDISQNITIDEVHSDVNTSKTFEKSENDIFFETEGKKESEVKNTGTNEQKYLQSANINNINEENSLVNEHIDSYLNTFDSTPLRDEPTPVQDELRQDDSVSNSYSAFSRFNRRNRSNSESAEDSAEESDSEVKNVSDSRNSSISRESCKSQSDSDNESGNSVKSDEGLSGTELKESALSHLTLNKDNQTSQDSISSVTLKSNSRKSSSTSSSSSSDSDSDSSSSSSSSFSSESETSLENSKSQKLKSVTKSKIISKADTRKLDSAVHRDFKSKSHIKRKRSPTNNLNDRNLKGREDKEKDSGSKRKDYSGREIERDKTSPIKEKTGKERYYYRKSLKERISPEEVKADPEFDATNYRDETMYQKNDRSRHGKDRVDHDRKHDRENRVGNRKFNSKSRDEFEREDQGKSKDKRERPIEKRYFEEIGRLKMEETRVSRDSSNKKDNETSYRHRKRSRSNSAESKTPSKNRIQGMESNKSERNAKISKSDSYLTSSKAARSQKDMKTESKERRKSVENSKRKSSDEKAKSKVKSSKDELKTKRRSLEEKLQRLASQTEKSDFDSGSEKNVSSLSDLSSDSETETWRDKKHGASRKSADIELERRRREQKERGKERHMLRKADKNNMERGDGDKDWNKKSKHKVIDSKMDKYDSEYIEKQTYRKGDHRDKRKDDFEDSSRQRNYHKKHTIFYEKDHKKKFEELSSDSESGVRKGVVSVVKTGQKKASEQIPSLLDISVSKPKSVGRDHKVRSKSPKKERLIIHVEKSSDDEISSTKSKKKKVKKRKKVSSDDDETLVKQIVNVTFDKGMSYCLAFT